ncbi:Vacuolar ATPase assembly integral membrane protein vma21 [Trichoplax sp. H2]|nr:Vacuolar ATPase assembly integral membrane protein vma21 [Trichoplax sp. H2]|eukprot:RDD46762.1 Vacuolar ATPase assembly integral membrane protein vma21 [Trichoplax sp. H2]
MAQRSAAAPIAQHRAQVGTQFGPRELSVLMKLLFYSIAMITLPIGSYFLTKGYLFEAYMGIENGSIPAAIVTVVMVHVIIGFYIRSAWNEEVAEKPKDD